MAELQEPFAPINTTLITDAPVAVQAQIPAAKNYAGEEDIRNYCQTELFGIITRCKDRRKALEDEWLAIQRLRTLTHDGGQKYKGRSNVYLPNYANAHSTLVSQLSRGLFPSDDYMDVEPQQMEGMIPAENVKAALKYELDCNARLRSHVKPALSQLVDHGNMVLKYGYRTGQEFIGRKAKNSPAAFRSRPQKGLWVSSRSIFNVVVYPETAEDENDILITAEFIDLDKNYAMALWDSKRWLNKEYAMGSDATDKHQYSRDQSLQDMAKIPGMTEQIDRGDPAKPTVQHMTCIEAYASIRLPKDAYVEGENTALPVPARIIFVNGIPVEVTRNMHFDQKHPYLWSRQGIVPGSFYGSWAGRRARYLQYLINDLANQTNDTGIMGLNPFMIVDTNLLSGPLMPYAPGRVFHVRDVKNAISFQYPPMEPIQYGQQMVNMYAGALVDGVGAPPVLQGVGKSGETATGQSILQRNALSPLQDVVEDIEAQVMVPLLERAWRLIVQFTDRPVLMPDPMTGMPRPVEVADLDEFDYNFKFLSSTQAQNQAARAMQAQQMLTVLPQVNQMLMVTGKFADAEYVLKKLAADFGWRQFEQFVKPMPMMGGMQIDPATGQPMANPQMPMGPEQNAPGGQNEGQDPAAGGQEELAATRAPVDEINAMEQKRGLG